MRTRYPLSMATSSFGKFEKVLRLGEGRRLKRLAEQAAYITSLEPDFEVLTDAELLAKSAEFKERIANGESLDDILYEAFAAAREARKRESGQRLFDVQLMGGIALHEGGIAEMKWPTPAAGSMLRGNSRLPRPSCSTACQIAATMSSGV